MSASQPALSLIKSLAYMDGRWCEARGGRRFEVLNPATGQLITQVPDMDEADTRLAIAAAHRAQPAWAALTAKERSNKLYAWFELIMANQDELARIMTCEQGKPLAEARGEVAYGASFIQWFSEEGIKDRARELGMAMPGEKRIEVQGLDGDSDASSSQKSSNAKKASEVAKEIEEVGKDVPWYIQALDMLFGFNGVEGQTVVSNGK